jgi:hypothetical protein
MSDCEHPQVKVSAGPHVWPRPFYRRPCPRAITADTYMHVTPGMQREAAAALDAVLGG